MAKTICYNRDMPAKKVLGIFCAFILFFLFGLFVYLPSASSDALDDVNKQISDLTGALNQSINATKPLESQLNAMQQQILTIKQRVVDIEYDMSVKKKEIDNEYSTLAEKQKVLNETIANFYVKSYSDSPFLIFLSSNNATDMVQTLEYDQAKTNQDKAIIANLALTLIDLENKKQQLEEEQRRLTSAKANLDEQSAKLDKIVAGAKAYQATLSNQIASLSIQQQQLIAAKYATLNIPQTAYTMQGGCSSDLTNGKDPGFSPRFGFFTYGVPNRIGMNQYGAKGRAEAGQDYKTILNSYYNADLTTGYNTSINIHVTGTNEYGQSFDDNWNIEDYVKHIYEIPTDWPAEALKAQAIAARSYALATTNNGSSSICPSQQCQVVKRESNSQAWIDAVNATSGQVLTSGGQPIKAWFSSTHGGYIFKSSDIGWSATSYTKNAIDASGSINSFSDLQSLAYDKSSPWFYCDWGSRSAYAGTAWLKSDEVADIANVVLLAQSDSSTTKHLSQLDKANPDGVDTWNPDRVRQELQSRNVTPFTSVNSIGIDWDKSIGRTTTVTVTGNTSQTFSADSFKNFFNVRAPANIQIVGPLYNVEIR